MYATCCCCESVVEVTIDEYLAIDSEINDYLCDDCSEELYQMMIDWKLRVN
jgi:uncharacterized protein YlaI